MRALRSRTRWLPGGGRGIRSLPVVNFLKFLKPGTLLIAAVTLYLRRIPDIAQKITKKKSLSK
jgi:hypothetical protein